MAWDGYSSGRANECLRRPVVSHTVAQLVTSLPVPAVVGTATNGEEAVEQAEAMAPDLILMDVHMPVMDGIAATERVRQLLPDCQVVMLTTFDDDEYIIRSLRAGTLDHIPTDLVDKLAPSLAQHAERVGADPIVAAYYASRAS